MTKTKVQLDANARRQVAAIYALQLHGQEVFVAHCVPNCCVLATRVVLGVLDWAGVAARPVPTQCDVFNAAAIEFLEKHHKLPESEEDPLLASWNETRCKWLSVGAPDVATTNGLSPTGFDGHLVTVCDSVDGHRLLIDIATHQFNRPEYGMQLTALVGTIAPQQAAFAPLAQYLHDNCRLQYWSRPELDGYQTYHDWTAKSRRQPLIALLVRKARVIEEHLKQHGTIDHYTVGEA